MRLPDTGAVRLPLSRRTFSLGLGLCAARAALGDSALAPPALLARAPADATAQRGRAILARYAALRARSGAQDPLGGEQVYTLLALNPDAKVVTAINTRPAAFLAPLIREQMFVTNAPEGFGNDDKTAALAIHGSDNHHILRHGVFLLGGQILAAMPDFADVRLPGGDTPATTVPRRAQSVSTAKRCRCRPPGPIPTPYLRSTDNPDVIEARDPHGATLSIMLV